MFINEDAAPPSVWLQRQRRRQQQQHCPEPSTHSEPTLAPHLHAHNGFQPDALCVYPSVRRSAHVALWQSVRLCLLGRWSYLCTPPPLIVCGRDVVASPPAGTHDSPRYTQYPAYLNEIQTHHSTVPPPATTTYGKQQAELHSSKNSQHPHAQGLETFTALGVT